MNKKVKTILTLIIIVICVFVALVLISDEDRNYNNYNYSSYSSLDMGTKAMFLSMEQYGSEIGIDVKTNKKYARFIPDNSVVLVVEPVTGSELDTYELNSMISQITKGSTYIFAYSNILTSEIENISEQYIESVKDKVEIYENTYFDSSEIKLISAYKIGAGKVLFLKLDNEYLNSEIRKDSEDVVSFIKTIFSITLDGGYSKIIVDEHYHAIEENSLSDAVGLGVILSFAAVCIAVLIWGLYKANRFGAPVFVPETVKRIENENIFALAGLYSRTKSSNIAVEVNIEALLNEISISLGYGSLSPSNREIVISSIMKNKRMIDLGAALLISEYVNNNKKKINKKQLKKIILKIEKIRREL